MLIMRSDPPLPLTRPHVRGQLTEFPADDLRFTAVEAAALFQDVMRRGLGRRAAPGRARPAGCADRSTFVNDYTGPARVAVKQFCRGGSHVLFSPDLH